VAVITSGHCALHLRIQAPAVAQRRRRGFGRPATLPGERRASTRRVRHNSLAQFPIRHTASRTISGITSKLIRPDANACMPRAAAQGTRARPHHRRRWRPRRLRPVRVHDATVGVTAPDSTIRPPSVPGGSLAWLDVRFCRRSRIAAGRIGGRADVGLIIGDTLRSYVIAGSWGLSRSGGAAARGSCAGREVPAAGRLGSGGMGPGGSPGGGWWR